MREGHGRDAESEASGKKKATEKGGIASEIAGKCQLFLHRLLEMLLAAQARLRSSSVAYVRLCCGTV